MLKHPIDLGRRREQVMAQPAHLRFAAQMRRELLCPSLPREIRIALLRAPGDAAAKPAVFSTLDDLAKALHRDRGEAAIMLADAALQLRGDTSPRAGVSVWTLGPDGQSRDYLGWAYLAGSGRAVLAAALNAACPTADAREG